MMLKLTHATLALAFAATLCSSGPALADAKVKVEEVSLVRQQVLVKEIAAAPAELQGKIRKAVTDATNAARRQGLDVIGPPVVRYLDRSPTRFVVEAGVPIQGSAKPRPGLKIIELPTGKAATAVHVGTYETLAKTHAAIERWIKANKRKAGDKRWEVFLSNPVVVRDPAKRETKIFIPLE